MAKRLCLLLSLLAAAAAPATAGAALPADADVARSATTGKVTFVGAPATQPLARPNGFSADSRPSAVARGFLLDSASAFGLGEGATLELVRTEPAVSGLRAVRYQQRVDGVAVMGGQFTLTLDDANRVLSVLGEAEPAAHVDTVAEVAGSTAEANAVAAVARAEDRPATDLAATGTRLQVFDSRIMGGGGLERPTLVWTTEVADPTGAVSRLVIVDADLGNVVTTIEQHHAVKSRTVCDRNNVVGGAEACTSGAARVEGAPATGIADVDLAYDYAGATYDFFFTRFNRDSLDGAGLPLKSTVRFCNSSDPCPYQNAYWNGAQMVYGNGFASADDVVGHELTHGVTDYTSGLFYYAQSGAINESLSDVFGELIDQVTVGGNDTAPVKWQLGEDIGAIRNMADPPAFNDPDRVGSPIWHAAETDSEGVHINSGVNNKAAFLISDGGSFNGQTITGLGLEKTARLYYVVETTLLSSASDYKDLANALRQGCANLVGSNGFTAANCVEVGKAVTATEMDNETRAPETPRCASGTPTYQFSDDLETPASGRWATGAVSGLTNAWFYPQNPNGVIDATYATSGSTNMWGYDRPTTSDSAIRMTSGVAVAAGAFLFFRHAYAFEDSAGTNYDGGVVEYSTDGTTWLNLAATPYTGNIAAGQGNPLAGRAAFVANSHGYVSTRVSLAALAGQTVRFRFRIGTDSGVDDYGWFIDDIDIHTCGTPDTTPPDTTITSGPAEASSTTDNTPTFAFTSTEAGSFECSVDSGTYAACVTPFTTAALSAGSHTFRVRAKDAANNTDPTPATRTFAVTVPTPTPTPTRTVTPGATPTPAPSSTPTPTATEIPTATAPAATPTPAVLEPAPALTVTKAKVKRRFVALTVSSTVTGVVAVKGARPAPVTARVPLTIRAKLSKAVRKARTARKVKVTYVLRLLSADGTVLATTKRRVALPRLRVRR